MNYIEIKEIERKKRSLKRYKKNLSCIARLEERRISLVTRIESVGSPKLSDMPRGGTPITKEELIIDKIELEERINRLKVKSQDLKRETYEEIDKLDDVRYVEVLECMFIDCLDLDQTADKLGYHARHVQRLYSEALKELALGSQ